jgi:hypothetical protein
MFVSFKRGACISAVLLGALALALPAVIAEDKEQKEDKPAAKAEKKEGKNVTKNKDKGAAKATAQSQAISDLALANSLAAYGRKNKSAAALVSAARILASTRTAELEAKKESKPNEKAGKGKDERPESAAADNSPKALLAEAVKLAPDDESIAAQAKQVEALLAESPRGAFPYPKEGQGVVAGYTTDYYVVDYRGGELATVSVSGDGYTDLDLYVYDENDNLITYDESYSDQCFCSWAPIWTGPFTIYVKNNGASYNRYTIWTN